MALLVSTYCWGALNEGPTADNPARCTTASASSSASGQERVRSQERKGTSRSADSRSLTPVGSWPASTSSRTRWRPTKPVAPVTATRIDRSALLQGHVVLDHQPDEAGKVVLAAPAEHARRLRRVAKQDVHLGGAHEGGVLLDVGTPVVDADLGEGQGEEVLDRVGLAGGEHEVVGLVVLEHLP